MATTIEEANKNWLTNEFVKQNMENHHDSTLVPRPGFYHTYVKRPDGTKSDVLSKYTTYPLLEGIMLPEGYTKFTTVRNSTTDSVPQLYQQIIYNGEDIESKPDTNYYDVNGRLIPDDSIPKYRFYKFPINHKVHNTAEITPANKKGGCMYKKGKKVK